MTHHPSSPETGFSSAQSRLCCMLSLLLLMWCPRFAGADALLLFQPVLPVLPLLPMLSLYILVGFVLFDSRCPRLPKCPFPRPSWSSPCWATQMFILTWTRLAAGPIPSWRPPRSSSVAPCRPSAMCSAKSGLSPTSVSSRAWSTAFRLLPGRPWSLTMSIPCFKSSALICLNPASLIPPGTTSSRLPCTGQARSGIVRVYLRSWRCSLKS